jgi:hypothetical protein
METKSVVVPEDFDYETFAEEWKKHDSKVYVVPSDYIGSFEDLINSKNQRI